jgi:hypothetical protein
MEDDTEEVKVTHIHTRTHTRKIRNAFKTFVGKILGKGYSEGLGYRERYYKPSLQSDV